MKMVFADIVSITFNDGKGNFCFYLFSLKPNLADHQIAIDKPLKRLTDFNCSLA